MDKFLSHKRTFDDNKASTSAQTSIVPKIKSRKYSQEYLNFGFTITEVNGEEKPLCVICSKILAADSMKPNKLKRHFETLHARCKKPHTIAEELILPAAIEIVETMFGDNFAKELQSIPLSNDTVSRRIDDIAEDVEQQLFGKLRDKLFSIQLDEATDSNKDAHFIAYVRFWDASRRDVLLARRIVRSVHESSWEQWTREGTHARKTGSGATRKTTRREDPRIVRQAFVDPIVTRSTIRAGVGVAIVPQTSSKHLAEANLKSKRPFRALPLIPEHRQQRLQWC
ncbi:SCAN domain-containing protein 3 [Trichonephila clavipes]|nr:SCAN domain-containing protein 3 [Trichonephila clavipes]